MKKILSTLLAILLLTSAVACGEVKDSLPQAETPGNQTDPLSVEDAAPAFSDVAEGAWYAEAVRYCAERGLMDGTSSAAFSPDALASRGVLVTALYRRAGSPGPQQEARFTDIPSGAAYGSAAAWAAEAGVPRIGLPPEHRSVSPIRRRFPPMPLTLFYGPEAPISSAERETICLTPNRILHAGRWR